MVSFYEDMPDYSRTKCHLITEGDVQADWARGGREGARRPISNFGF